MSQKMGLIKFKCLKKWDLLNLYFPKKGTYKFYMTQKMGHIKYICTKK